MPRTGMRRVSLAVVTAALLTMSGLSGAGTAHAAAAGTSFTPVQVGQLYQFPQGATAAGQTIGQHHGVHRPRRGAGDALDDKPLVT